MHRIAKDFSFDIAHLLDGHDGKCQNLHGHTYRLQVEVCGELHADGPKKGMVIDFADLKAVVSREVLEPMDHAFLYDRTSERESRIAVLLQELDSKTFALPVRTTAEEIARFICERLRAQGLPVSAIRLWETPTSFCEYTPPARTAPRGGAVADAGAGTTAPTGAEAEAGAGACASAGTPDCDTAAGHRASVTTAVDDTAEAQHEKGERA